MGKSVQSSKFKVEEQKSKKVGPAADIRYLIHPQILRITQKGNQFKVQATTAARGSEFKVEKRKSRFHAPRRPGVQSRVSVSGAVRRARQRIERDPTLTQAFQQISLQLKNKQTWPSVF